MSAERNSHSPDMPAESGYKAAIDRLVALYTQTPEMERAFADLLRMVEACDEAWRGDDFEGASGFLTSDGQMVVIGRRLHEDELKVHQKAWESGDQPFQTEIHTPRPREQVYRVMYGNEAHELTVPAFYQPWYESKDGSVKGLNWKYATRSVDNDNDNGIDGVRGEMVIYGGLRSYDTDVGEPGEGLKSLYALFGEFASLGYDGTHFNVLYAHKLLLGYDREGRKILDHELPNIEDVAVRIEAAPLNAH